MTVEFELMPENLAKIYLLYGDLPQVVEKIILPQVLSVSRLKGSSYRAQDFIMGEGRETFQYDLSQVLGSGPDIACAFGVWAMLFLAATLAAAGAMLGSRIGSIFKL